MENTLEGHETGERRHEDREDRHKSDTGASEAEYRQRQQSASLRLTLSNDSRVQTEGPRAHTDKDARVSSVRMTTERLHPTHGLGKESPWEAFLTRLLTFRA